MLVERRGHFLQLLEGPEANVRALYSKIVVDRRHSLITLQGECYSATRLFPGWSMSRVKLVETESRVVALVDLFELGRGRKLFSEVDDLLLILKKFGENSENFEMSSGSND